MLTAVALAVSGTALVVAKQGPSPNESPTTRVVGTPSLKMTPDGKHVRWHSDVDVVIDKSFSDLAGNKVFSAAVDAWRATGAMLPSISTAPGKDRQVGYRATDRNENVVVYAPKGWSKAKGALGITILSYLDGTGQIVDADLLLNGGDRVFAQFERDESNGHSVSIEGTGSTSQSNAAPSKTERYDVQSVLTHELGHFFGLGEDYEDSKATMYATTRPGETHKRIVTKNESAVITALYDEGMRDPSETRGGCGRAQVARGSASSQASLVGCWVAAIGLGLLALSRRRGDVARGEAPVRVRRTRAARRIGRIGSWLTAGGLITLLAPPSLEAAPEPGAVRGDAEVQIVRAEPRWVDGVVETELTFRVTACHVANCPDTDQRVVAFGGKLGGITQLVGPFAVPEVGAYATVGLRDGRGLLQTLKPIFKP